MTQYTPRPDDDPQVDDRCKDCGLGLTWVGPSQSDWEQLGLLPDKDEYEVVRRDQLGVAE